MRRGLGDGGLQRYPSHSTLPYRVGNLESKSTLAQEDGEVEIAGRMTEAGQEGGALGAVLCPVIHDMGEAVPEHAMAHGVMRVVADCG